MEQCTVIPHSCTAQARSKHVQDQRLKSSVHLLDSWAAATPWCTAHIVSWHSTFWHATTACGLIDFHHDGVDNPFKLLLLCLEFILLGQLVLVQPVQSLLHGLLDLVLVITLELLLQLLLLQGVAHGEAVVLQAILGLELGPVLLIFGSVLFCLL